MRDQEGNEDLEELLENVLQYSALFSVSRFYHHAFHHPLRSLPPATAFWAGDGVGFLWEKGQ